MIATCKCAHGHTWTTRVLSDEPDTNTTTVENDQCPTCGSEQFEINDIEFDEPDYEGL